jgi:hypothetical protein
MSRRVGADQNRRNPQMHSARLSANADEDYLQAEETYLDFSPALLIGAEDLPGKINVKGLRREAATCRRRALDGDLSR